MKAKEKEPTEEEIETYCQNIISKLKQEDSQYELKVEFGKLLMIHIDDFTPSQRKRYEELKSQIK